VDATVWSRRKESKRKFGIKNLLIYLCYRYLSLSLAFASQLPRQMEPLIGCVLLKQIRNIAKGTINLKNCDNKKGFPF